MDHPSIQYVSSEDGDWHGLYVNGKLVDQNHSLSMSRMLEEICCIIGINYETMEVNMDSYYFTNLPEYYDEIEMEITESRKRAVKDEA